MNIMTGEWSGMFYPGLPAIGGFEHRRGFPVEGMIGADPSVIIVNERYPADIGDEGICAFVDNDRIVVKIGQVAGDVCPAVLLAKAYAHACQADKNDCD